MEDWLTPEIAVLLMASGVIPSLVNVHLLYDERRQPGALWFVASMATGGAWALLYAAFTAIPSPQVTLALANFFWAMIPTAAVTMFLLAYEFVFKKTVSRRTVAVLFSPIVLLFVLSWFNPANLVFTPEYHVGPDGILRFPHFGGPVKVLVTQVYGYLLVFLAAGMFVGEAMQSSGVRRRQAIYLLVVFSILVGSTMVKVAGLVPAYFDPTSAVYSLSGILFAYSINRHGLLKFAPIAREQTFQEVNDAIVVVGSNGLIADANERGRGLFGPRIVGEPIEEVLTYRTVGDEDRDGTPQTIQLADDEHQRYFSLRLSPIEYGRGLTGEIYLLSDVSALKEREHELDLLKQIFARVFRHDIRNHLTVINGHAEFMKDRLDDSGIESADVILKNANQLLDHVEKARKIDEVFTDDELVTRSLRDEVDAVVSDYRTRPDVEVRSSVEDVIVDVHPRFDLAVRELIENAMAHHDAADATEIALYTEVTDESVELVVEDNGPGLPRHEVEVLRADRETDLRHSSGIGLWLVRWIATRSNGDVVAEASDDGTRVRIRLPRPGADEADRGPGAG